MALVGFGQPRDGRHVRARTPIATCETRPCSSLASNQPISLVRPWPGWGTSGRVVAGRFRLSRSGSLGDSASGQFRSFSRSRSGFSSVVGLDVARVAAPLAILGLTIVHAFYWTDLRMRAPIVPAIALVAASARVPGRPRFDKHPGTRLIQGHVGPFQDLTGGRRPASAPS